MRVLKMPILYVTKEQVGTIECGLRELEEIAQYCRPDNSKRITKEIKSVRLALLNNGEIEEPEEVEEADPFQKATIAEIRILAETSSIHKLVLDKLPDSLAEDTMIYDDAYFFENVCEDRLIDIETLITEKYPFVPSGFLDNSSMEYVRYYYNSVSLVKMETMGTIFGMVDTLIYRNEK